MTDKTRYQILEGPIIGAILRIAIPIIFANTLQTVYQLIDTFWVGRLGAEAVAAVSLSFPILFLLMSFGIGFSMAGSIFVAQFNGKDDKKNVCLATAQALSLATVSAVVISIIGFLSSGFLMSFFTDDPIVFAMAVDYLKVSFLGMIAMFVYFTFQAVYRGIGEVKIPMYIILATVVINFFIDPLFMYGYGIIPALGVTGVALATVVTEAMAALIAIFLLARGKQGIKLRFSDLKMKREWVNKIFALGLPSSLEHSSRAIGMVVMTLVVSYFGTIAIASFGIGSRILSFIIIPAIGLSIATSSLVGNNLGARQKERAEIIVKTALKIGFVSLSVIGIFLFLFASHIAKFFVPNEPEVITIATDFLHYVALTFGFIGIQMVVIGTLKAAGMTVTSMILALFNAVMVLILSLSFAFGVSMGVLGIWIAYPINNILSAVLAWYYYKKKDWYHKGEIRV